MKKQNRVHIRARLCPYAGCCHKIGNTNQSVWFHKVVLQSTQLRISQVNNEFNFESNWNRSMFTLVSSAYGVAAYKNVFWSGKSEVINMHSWLVTVINSYGKAFDFCVGRKNKQNVLQMSTASVVLSSILPRIPRPYFDRALMWQL